MHVRALQMEEGGGGGGGQWAAMKQRVEQRKEEGNDKLPTLPLLSCVETWTNVRRQRRTHTCSFVVVTTISDLRHKMNLHPEWAQFEIQ